MKKLYVVTAFSENKRTNTIGHRTCILSATSEQEAKGLGVERFEENEPGNLVYTPSSISITSDLLESIGISPVEYFGSNSKE